MAPAFAILGRFSCLFLASNLISIVACFCSSMEQETNLRTSCRMSSSEFSEDGVGNSADLSLLQSLKAEKESWLNMALPKVIVGFRLSPYMKPEKEKHVPSVSLNASIQAKRLFLFPQA